MKPTFLFKFHNIFYEKHVHIQFLIKKPSLLTIQYRLQLHALGEESLQFR